MSSHQHNALSFAGLLITVGIIFGDIGTSPLYVLKAITNADPVNGVEVGKLITNQLILGALSCIFWTLTLQTTIKYVIITLRADNKGEGGIFSLYTLVRRRKKWLVVPAMIGGAALLADGIITPPISVASAIEGLRYVNPEIQTFPIIIAIIIGIFVIQQFGTKIIGRAFGPVMMIWFLMLGVVGFASLMTDFSILKALNPYYAYDLLVHYPKGFWLLGAVFMYHRSRSLVFRFRTLRKRKHSCKLDFCESNVDHQLLWSRSIFIKQSCKCLHQRRKPVLFNCT